MQTRPASCERTAQFVSLDLDGELSAYGRAMLKRHVQRCEICAEYAGTVAGLTELVRAEPLEEFRLPITLSGPRRRVSPIVRNIAAIAAVATVGVWLGVAHSGVPRAHTPFQTFNPPPVAPTDDSRDWPAGLPRAARVVQLSPGGLSTNGTTP
jgi:hypothetical protein